MSKKRNKDQAPPPGPGGDSAIEDIGPPHYPGPAPKPKTILAFDPDGRIVIVPPPTPTEPPSQPAE